MTDDLLDRRSVHALLADGTTVCIRPALAGDHGQLQGLYEEMSAENLRLRFFAASRRSAALAADRACAPARPGYLALLAEADGRVIGLAEYDTGEEKDDAEISIAVADGLHHRGVGTLLVEHLVSAARAEDITTFTADAPEREPPGAPTLRRSRPACLPPFRGAGGALHRSPRPGRHLPVGRRGPRPVRRRGQPRTAAAAVRGRRGRRRTEARDRWAGRSSTTCTRAASPDVSSR